MRCETQIIRFWLRQRRVSQSLRAHFPVTTVVENAYTCGRAKTLRVDANFFENGEKKLRFQMNTDKSGQGFSYWLCPPFLLFLHNACFILMNPSYASCTL